MLRSLLNALSNKMKQLVQANLKGGFVPLSRPATDPAMALATVAYLMDAGEVPERLNR